VLPIIFAEIKFIQSADERFSKLTEGKNTKNAVGRYWNTMGLLRWLLTSMILVIFRINYVVQIFSLLFFSLVSQIMLVSSQPLAN
jgi:hypothetical protein